MTSLPYRWHPDGTTKRTPVAGDFFPSLHKVYRVVDVRPVPEADWTDDDRKHVTGYLPEFQSRRVPLYLQLAEVNYAQPDGPIRHYRMGGALHYSNVLDVYSDPHYPICSTCLEPTPCRHRMAERMTVEAMTRMARYERPDHCPACGDFITARQESVTWPENLEVPGGPPVSFHVGRRECRYSSEQYRARLTGELNAAPGLFNQLRDL